MRVVFLGDSLTEGVEGAPYLRVLAARAAADARLRGVELINAGVGGDTARNMLARVERDVVARRPDAVLVLAGSNDCQTLVVRRRVPMPRTLRTAYYFLRYKGVLRAVSPDRYAAALRAIVAAIGAHTGAHIVLCTPPTIGEDPRSREWRTLDRYAAAARKVAAECGTDLLDLRAAFVRALEGLPAAPATGLKGFVNERRVREVSAQGIEAQARARGLRLTYDSLHLTARGAELVADVMWPWLVEVAAGKLGSTE